MLRPSPRSAYPQYGAAFQLVQQDGSRRGSSQAYHALRVAQNAQLKMPNGAVANMAQPYKPPPAPHFQGVNAVPTNMGC